MLDINFNADNIVEDITKALIKFKGNKTYNEEAYKKLLDKYAELVAEFVKLRDTCKAKKLPSKDDVAVMSSMMQLFGLTKEDGSIDIDKLNSFNKGMGKDS